MIQVNTFLSLVPRPHPRGKSLHGGVLQIPRTSLLSGENFSTANHIAENTICDSNTGNPCPLQHDDSNFLGTEKKIAISSQLQAMNICEAQGISQMPFNG